jgi:hypothetical protein
MAKFPIYLRVLPTVIMNGKGTGKQIVDDAATERFTTRLTQLIESAQVTVPDPKARNKEIIVNKYATDINTMKPKPKTGFTCSFTVIELSTSLSGADTTLVLKVSGVLGIWKEGEKGTGELAKGFLTGGGHAIDRAKDDRKLASMATDVAISVAEKVFKDRLEPAIKEQLAKP